jgi:putative ABC transport system permease protein
LVGLVWVLLGVLGVVFGVPLGIALSVLIYYQFGGVTRFAFSLPWGAILACVLGILAIVFATMMVSGAMIRNDNIVDTLKDENV